MHVRFGPGHQVRPSLVGVEWGDILDTRQPLRGSGTKREPGGWAPAEAACQPRCPPIRGHTCLGLSQFRARVPINGESRKQRYGAAWVGEGGLPQKLPTRPSSPRPMRPWAQRCPRAVQPLP